MVNNSSISVLFSGGDYRGSHTGLFLEKALKYVSFWHSSAEHFLQNLGIFLDYSFINFGRLVRIHVDCFTP